MPRSFFLFEVQEEEEKRNHRPMVLLRKYGHRWLIPSRHYRTWNPLSIALFSWRARFPTHWLPAKEVRCSYCSYSWVARPSTLCFKLVKPGQTDRTLFKPYLWEWLSYATVATAATVLLCTGTVCDCSYPTPREVLVTAPQVVSEMLLRWGAWTR